MRYEKKDQITAAKNVLHRILDVIFPEFVSLFSDITGKTAREVLNVAPTPLQIQALGIEDDCPDPKGIKSSPLQSQSTGRP